jgi:hypothetical protein
MLISTALLLDSIIRNSLCTPAKLPCRRVEVGYEVSNNLLQNSVEPQSLQSLSNHNDSFCPILDSPNTIQTDIHNLDLSYNDIHVINQNFYYHQNLKNKLKMNLIEL